MEELLGLSLHTMRATIGDVVEVVETRDPHSVRGSAARDARLFYDDVASAVLRNTMARIEGFVCAS